MNISSCSIDNISYLMMELRDIQAGHRLTQKFDIQDLSKKTATQQKLVSIY